MPQGSGLRAQLPERGLARWVVIGALVAGGAVAAGLTALIVIAAVTWFRS